MSKERDISNILGINMSNLNKALKKYNLDLDNNKTN